MFIYYLRYREHLIESYKERTNTTHPWLFVSKHGDTTGSPYSIDSYKKALERAYKRLERRKGLHHTAREKRGERRHMECVTLLVRALVTRGVDSKGRTEASASKKHLFSTDIHGAFGSAN